MKKIDRCLEVLEEAMEDGERRQIRRALNEIMLQRRDLYTECDTQDHFDSFSKALFHALILELDEEEEDSLETAEMCYAALGRILKMSEESEIDPEIIKRRLMLLHYFSDYLSDAVAGLFMPENRSKHLLDARNLAMDCLEKMQLLDLCWLGEHHPEFVEGDAQIESCDHQLTRNIGHEEIEDALKDAYTLHRSLTACLAVKYKKR